MKKRKVKLFASIASLAMVVAVMGVGVWAASQQSVKINSTVGFLGSGIQGSVTLEVEKAEEVQEPATPAVNPVVDTAFIDTNTTILNTPVEVANFAIGDTTTSETERTVDIMLNDVDGNGWFDKNDGTITYTFAITNTSTNVAIKYQVVAQNELEGWSASEPTGTVAVATDEENPTTGTVTVVFTYNGADKATIAKGTYIPSIMLCLANNDTQLGLLVDAAESALNPGQGV